VRGEIAQRQPEHAATSVAQAPVYGRGGVPTVWFTR